ncbi:MAG: glycine--tRNA ligase subunit beta [Woeseiaceae bacterium]|nr:glycine--tRNA ligase subunit beta [Woeseiaceae bacterium]
MSADLLVEIGTEELPPKALRSLIDAFAAGVDERLAEARLEHAGIRSFASPRRLALIIEGLADKQPDRRVSQKGPPTKIAFDDDGTPKPPALAFAKKCGVDVTELERTATDKGEWLSYETFETGRPTAELIADILDQALLAMPIPRRMRWGDTDIEFVRPVHWVVLLHGDEVLDASVLGVEAGRDSDGHRFHAPGPLPVASAGDYVETLKSKGYVIADMQERRKLVVDGVNAEAANANGRIVDGESLYDEVNALVEWPVAITGRFEDRFLELPPEVVISTLTGHQRYFPVEDANGDLMPLFVTVANLNSKDPARVIDGNERVIRPRLADAAFFWDSDKSTTLEERRAGLGSVVYQQGLGTLKEKSERIKRLVEKLAEDAGIDAAHAGRAAELCKCDLLTGMVGEFPDLQGIMGAYYADVDGEAEAVSLAIREHYQPRFAGDALPESPAGQLLAVADRLDTLAGVFALGKKPSGNRDPFGLRRAALGVVRILIECELEVDFDALLAVAIDAQPRQHEATDGLHEFVYERLKSYCADHGATPEAFDAVAAVGTASLPDFKRRIDAVGTFLSLPEAESLAAANKRIANILKKSGSASALDAALLSEPAELALHEGVQAATADVGPKLESGNYTEALKGLAVLRAPVDTFFDDVMVMAEDEKTRNNRLALLAGLRRLFSGVADISRLSIS